MQKGFTLVEIIIVIMIMSVFIGVGYTTYTKQFVAKDFDRQVDTFVTTLEFAKSRSMARDISPNSGCTQFDRYEVRVWQGNTPPQYRMRFICTAGAPNIALEVVQFNNITVSGLAASPADIQFHHPYGCTTDTCNAATTTIRLRNTVSATCKDISINSLGSISVGDLINGC